VGPLPAYKGSRTTGEGQQKYPSVLGGRDPIIRRAELGQSGTWYRVHVGSFATSEQATALCNSLKDAGGQCIVQKNTSAETLPPVAPRLLNPIPGMSPKVGTFTPSP